MGGFENKLCQLSLAAVMLLTSVLILTNRTIRLKKCGGMPRWRGSADAVSRAISFRLISSSTMLAMTKGDPRGRGREKARENVQNELQFFSQPFLFPDVSGRCDKDCRRTCTSSPSASRVRKTPHAAPVPGPSSFSGNLKMPKRVLVKGVVRWP